jgi:hypothetical protein
LQGPNYTSNNYPNNLNNPNNLVIVVTRDPNNLNNPNNLVIVVTRDPNNLNAATHFTQQRDIS